MDKKPICKKPLFMKGQTVRHAKSGDLYRIEETPERSLRKDMTTRDWVCGYSYRSTCPHTAHLLFFRDVDDFELNFEGVRSVALFPKPGDEVRLSFGSVMRFVNFEEDTKVVYRDLNADRLHRCTKNAWAEMAGNNVIVNLAD